MARILIVDDEDAISWGLVRLAESLGHEARAVGSAERALAEFVDFDPQVAILDIRLPGMDGVTAMPEFRRRWPGLVMVIMTAYGDLATAVRAIQEGAFEYLVKPFDLNKARVVLERAIAYEQVPQSTSQVLSESTMLGESPVMQEVFRQIALASRSSANILLFGESGTGKELAARAIHEHSDRSRGPFVAVNMASLNPALVESELFGHVRGAFTGADRRRQGRLEQVHGGTLFIDEVADVPLGVQTALLRVLEHGEVVPVGGGEPFHADFRIISATHRDLRSLVESGLFRHDLYFRLCGFQIDIPPLRQRGDDIVQLAKSFLASLSGPDVHFAAATLTELRRRSWYGNVRELRNAVVHATTMVRQGEILPEHLPVPASRSMAGISPEPHSTDLLEHELRRWADAALRDGNQAGKVFSSFAQLVEPPLLRTAMELHQSNCASAARALGIHRTTLRRKLDEYGIDSDSGDSQP